MVSSDGKGGDRAGPIREWFFRGADAEHTGFVGCSARKPGILVLGGEFRLGELARRRIEVRQIDALACACFFRCSCR